MDLFLNLNPIDNNLNFLIFFPGLNMNPLALKELAITLRGKGLWNTLIFNHDSGHSLLAEQEEVQIAYSKLKEQYPNSNFINIAHSYGALLSLNLDAHANIFISPAFRLNRVSNVIETFLSLMFFETFIPSFNLKKYRQRKRLSSLRYQELREIRKHTLSTLSKNNKRTLVFLDPKDELICYNQTQKFIKKQALNKWHVITINKEKSSIGSNHLNIDSETLGNTQFQSVTSQINDFLRQI